MKTALVLVLLCWSSLVLALGDPSKARGPGMLHSLPGKYTLQPIAPHSTLRSTNSEGYDPWMEQATGLPGGYFVGPLHVVDSNTVWALTNLSGRVSQAYVRTTNGGATWIYDTIHIADPSFCCAGVYAFDALKAWICMWDSRATSGGGIFGTTDGGMTWKKDTTAFKSVGGFADFVHFFDGNNGVCVGDPNNGYFEIYTTSNGGASWSRVPQANIPPPLNTEMGLTSFFSAAGNSLWFPTVGDAWGTGGRYYRTTDRGLTWSVHVYPGASPGWVPILGFQDDNVGLGCCALGEVSRTTDGGLNWTRVSSPSHLSFGNQIEFVPGTSGMYIGTAVWKYPSLKDGFMIGTAYTTDGGASWTGACGTDDNSFNLDFESASAGWRSGTGSNIYKWTKAQGRVIGTSVDTLNFVTLATGQMSDTIAVDAVNFGSDSFTVSGIVAPGNQYTVVTQPTLPALIPPLGSVRVGLRFTQHANGILKDSLVFVSNASNAQRACVYLQGTGTGAVTVEPTAEMPKAFALLQNYPNPFNPTTVVSYQLPVVSEVKLVVYDLLGREVEVLVNGRRAWGKYDVRFDCSGLASGVYVYRLQARQTDGEQAGDFVQSRKLLLLK